MYVQPGQYSAGGGWPQRACESLTKSCWWLGTLLSLIPGLAMIGSTARWDLLLRTHNWNYHQHRILDGVHMGRKWGVNTSEGDNIADILQTTFSKSFFV